MATSKSSPLDVPIEGLLATPTARLPYQHDVLLRSYLLERPDGNIVIYNSPGVTESAEAILALGVPDRMLINHAHEAMYGRPELDVPVFVGAADRAEVARALPIAGVFDGRHRIGADLEVIPTPGHTAGTTSFLWDDGSRRFLFTGDFLWIEHGEWEAVVLDESLRGAYLQSLALVRNLDFDVLVPWGVTDDGPPIGVVNGRDEVRDRVDAIIDRVASGGSR